MSKKQKKTPGKIKELAPSPQESSSLFGNATKLDPTISSLFSQSAGPVQAPAKASRPSKSKTRNLPVENEDELSELDESEVDAAIADDSEPEEEVPSDAYDEELDTPSVSDGETPAQARKRKPQDDDLEGRYLHKLAQEDGQAAYEERASKRQKISEPAPAGVPADAPSDSENLGPPPVHEALAAPKREVEADKAARTIFLANVSNEAIVSKSAKRELLTHLASPLAALSADDGPHKVESLRFRSTAFAGKIPKKAAFARKDLMESTSKSTNAYAVYSTRGAARAAAAKLNGTVVLGRHLRADSVAHPAPIDHRRCVFVGNLGFVDDETQIKAAEDAQGYKGTSSKAQKGDVEEGLWQQFGKAGRVESVRVVRDTTTRVGKGFAYVQFADQNGVEAALLFNEKKYPPLLPRKLRVVRAKNPAVTAGALERRAESDAAKKGRKADRPGGRDARLLGRAGAANARASAKTAPRGLGKDGVRKPETFVFEGQRASSKQGNAGLKLNKGGKKGGKPTGRSAKRGAAWKSKAKASASGGGAPGKKG